MEPKEKNVRPESPVIQEEAKTPEQVVKAAVAETGMSQELLMQAFLQIAESQKQMANLLTKKEEVKQIEPDRFDDIEAITRKVDHNRPGKNLTYKIMGDSYKYHLHLSSKTHIYRDGKQFQLRYVKNYDTPFVEMQDGEVEIGDIDFEGQTLTVGENICLFRFLELHPGNVKNGGHLFKLIDVKADAKNELELLKLQDDARKYIRSLGSKDLKAIARYVTSVDFSSINYMTDEQVMLLLLKECDTKAEKILQVKDDPRVESVYYYNLGITMGIIGYDEPTGRINNKNTGRELISVPPGEDPGMFVAGWAIRDEKGTAFVRWLKEKTALT